MEEHFRREKIKTSDGLKAIYALIKYGILKSRLKFLIINNKFEVKKVIYYELFLNFFFISE